MTNSEVYWFALGYYDGRTVGVEDSLGELDGDKDAANRAAYKRGYDQGVFDYCEMDIEEDEA